VSPSKSTDTSAELPVRNLDEAADRLLEQVAVARTGRSALSLLAGPATPLKQTLLALRGGARLEEHESPGASTLQVLRGRVRVVAGDQAWQLRQGDHLKLPDERHRLDGVEDAVILLTVAMSG
jgi:quercetin dioxygenase-like cupin family protein